MNKKINTFISATGAYIPTVKIENTQFLTNTFFDKKGQLLAKQNNEIVAKFKDITTIDERRYAEDHLVTSDIAYLAAKNGIESSNIDKETIDQIIVAHNFGDIKKDNKKSDLVPSLAARVKYKLEIKNPNCVAYDVIFGCPGWLQAMIQAHYYIQSGDAKRILVIGAEIMSRIADPHDIDSMLYADGAGAAIIEASTDENKYGILAHATRSDTFIYSTMLAMGESYNQEDTSQLYLKMEGRKLYQYALETVPQAMKDCLDKCGLHINDVNKVLLHQANGKMDDAILERLYNLYDVKSIPKNVMPMTIAEFGNSSVATLPTLLDLILKKKIEGHEINKGDILLFASVGAGMNINCMVYKV